MTAVLVVAPHADDETLGCGGTLLRHVAQGDAVHWLVLTAPAPVLEPEAAAGRAAVDLDAVAAAYGFAEVACLHLPDAGLDTVPRAELVARVGEMVRRIEPEVVYLPYRSDAHSDHRFAFDAVAACGKWFRYRSVRRLLVYETPSETDFGLDPDRLGFRPNVFVDITPHLERKLAILRFYSSEMGIHPFPRSEAAIRALAVLRGAAAGCDAAESFLLLKEIR